MRPFKFEDLDMLPSFFAAITLIDLINGGRLSSSYPFVKIAWLVLWLAAIGYLIDFAATCKWRLARVYI